MVFRQMQSDELKKSIATYYIWMFRKRKIIAEKILGKYLYYLMNMKSSCLLKP